MRGAARKPHPKRKFTPDDDALLRAAVSELGTQDWESIAARVPGRNARQCRDRWATYLSPSVSAQPWTAEEERLLAEGAARFGTAWKRIARLLPCRTNIHVKNHWQMMQRRLRKRPVARQKPPPPFIVPLPLREGHAAEADGGDDSWLVQSLMMCEDEEGVESWFEAPWPRGI
jgi:hypothetical protein